MDLKISDYNFNISNNNTSNTAPETIQITKPSEKTDSWTLGVLLFEMIHGFYPFKGKTSEERTVNILSDNKKKFASFISDEAQDLISRLLCRNPQERLTMKEIFAHKWMAKFYTLFNVNIEKFQHPEKKRKSFENNINIMKRKNILEKKGEFLERKTVDVADRKEILPLKLFSEGLP